MKLTMVLLIAASLHLSATGFGQKVSISGKDLSLEKVFTMIKKQTSYVFFYDYSIFQGARPVSLDLKDAEVEDVLRACLQGQNLDFSITNKTISITKKVEKKTETVGPGSEKTVKARGVVLTEVGEPLSGASITIKKSGKNTLTNAKGEFILPEVPVNSTLIISFVGYTPQLVSVREEQNDMKVYLSIAKNELDKVVVQAYGTTTQRLNTGNITTVTAAEIERQPVMNPLIALEGKVPGVTVTPTSGYASAPIRIEIRGRSVIDDQQPSEPLYIIDGVPLTVLNLGNSNYESGSRGFAQGYTGPAGGQSPFFSINPQDIESITVLKDADATAIYGSRGANGVIIVNTKTGKAGKAKLDVNIYQGESMVTGRYQLMNTQQYLMMRREAFKNDQITYGLIPDQTIPSPDNAYDLLTWDTTRYTNWQNVYWGALGHTTDVNVSLSGGDKQNTYRIGGNFHRETSIMSHSGADSRGSAQFNYTHKSTDQRMNFSLTSSYSVTQSNLISVGGNVLEAPNAPPIINSQGNLNYSGWEPVPDNLNYWSSLFIPYNAKTGFLNSQIHFQYQILRGLNFTTQLGYSTAHNTNLQLTTIKSQNPIYNTPYGSSVFGNTNLSNSIIEPQFEYKGIIAKKGKLNVLIGGSSQSSNSDANTENGNGYVNDNLLSSLINAPITSTSNAFGNYRYAALFGRVNFNWSDRYLVNLSARRDGSSRFGSGHQYGNFWAIGAAWIFTEETWVKDHFPVLSFGKFRGSYGLTGNDQIGDYGYLTQWSSTTGNFVYQGQPSYQPLGHANPDLHWETNRKLEGALDVGFLKDRITMEIDWYRNRCGDQLVYFPLPYISGFSSVRQNSPALIQNSGIEFIFKAKIVDNRKLSWAVNFNVGQNRNKLVAYPNLAQSPYAYSYDIGQSLSIVRLLHNTGVDPQTGQYTFQDKNHNGIIDYNYNTGNTYNSAGNDRYNKDLAIKLDGGLGTDLRYKGWQMNLYFQFREQQLPSGSYAMYPGGKDINQPIELLNNRWQKPGDHKRFARFTQAPQLSDQLFSISDGVYTDGSYFRLRNASLSYELSENWIRRAGFQKCMIYLRGQNLFKLTHYDGVDPDVPVLGAFPPPKVFVLGVQFTF